MTEDGAREWIAAQFGVGAVDRLALFAKLLTNENARQNLVSRAAFASLWCRHIVDSAQLTAFAPADGLWIDIGSGGGFPGMVVAMVRNGPVTLVEPRRRRAEFLAEAAATLGLGHVTVRQCKIASLQDVKANVVSARAVASIALLLRDAQGVADRDTVFVFPRGRSGMDELSLAKQSWRGVFHVKQSITDPEAAIIVARGVRAA